MTCIARVCQSCGARFECDASADLPEQCRLCVVLDAEMYANDPTLRPDVSTPWKCSRSVMRERLSVSGNEDV